jgi:hypothetical protein
MANRENHYEAAFESWLRSRGVPYVAVDETRRSLLAQASIKSLDFIVTTPQGVSWLVDVKGRLFPGGRRRQYWRNWSTLDDLEGLACWERLFGERFHGLFVFAYNVIGTRSPLPAERLFSFRGRSYGFVGIRLDQYMWNARPISPRWGTVAMSARQFVRLARPADELL